MALVINTGLTATDGSNIDTGSYVRIDISFPYDEAKYYAGLYMWRSEQAYIDGLGKVKPLSVDMGYEKELTYEEYTGLTPTVIHQDVQAHLEQFVGVGNVDIIP